MPSSLDVHPGDRILVSRTDRLGDLILALPLVQSLKARFPEAHVDVLASAYAAPILKGHPSIGEVIAIESAKLTDGDYRKTLLREIEKRRYASALVVYPEKSVARLLKDAKIPHRVGTAGRLHSLYFNHRWFHSRKGSVKHEAEYNLDFLRYFADGPTIDKPSIYIDPSEMNAAGELLRASKIATPFVVLHPGSGGSADSWPVERFIELSDILLTAGMETVLTGSEREKQVIERLAAGSAVPKSIAGKTDLRLLAAVLAQASVVVANSTGPLHLAAAVGTRVVGLYPHRKEMAPRRWGPIGEGHRIVQPKATICRCSKGRCECMFSITAREVADEIKAIWAESAQGKLKT